MAELDTGTIIITITLLFVIIVELIKMARETPVRRKSTIALDVIEYPTITFGGIEYRDNPSPNRYSKKYFSRLLSSTNQFHVIFIIIEFLFALNILLFTFPGSNVFYNQTNSYVQNIIFIVVVLCWATIPLITVREYDNIIAEGIYPGSLHIHTTKSLTMAIGYAFYVSGFWTEFGDFGSIFGISLNYVIFIFFTILTLLFYISKQIRFISFLEAEISKIDSE